MENEERVNQEINDLKKKYEEVIKKIDKIEKESKDTANSISRIENSVGTMNSNFEELMKKLDSVVEDRESDKMFDNVKRSGISLKKMITGPIRKLAVCTISSVFCIADYASEKFSYAREGVEDIIAEAQYNSKKRRSSMMSDMEPSGQ
jgi:predicted nuclease with TOPRIM domain